MTSVLADTTIMDNSFVDKFADISVLRYKVPSWDSLNLETKKLVYYLAEAGRCGWDIIWDQNYRYNLEIRDILCKLWKSDKIDKKDERWILLSVYIKRVFFSNGIHHHYSNEKIIPECTQEYFQSCLDLEDIVIRPSLLNIIFDKSIDKKKVEQDSSVDVVLNSCVNFYEPGITLKEVKEFYEPLRKADSKISHGLNRKLVRDANDKENGVGKLKELVYCENGLYGSAIKQIIYNLEKAQLHAPKNMADGLQILIEYFKTGDLQKWDEYCIHWVTEGKAKDKDNFVDYIIGFIEVYSDPIGMTGTFESVVQIIDVEATNQMKVLQKNAQYFEDNSPIQKEHKKENVVGITFNFVNVASTGGDNSPASAIGINLPNSDWIRTEYGSKSVTLANISKAGASTLKNEFCHSSLIYEREQKYGEAADLLHTSLHEVIGHGSGKLELNVNAEALQQYYSTIEEGRADLVALYYMMDPNLVQLGLMENMDLGKSAYDDYITNGLLIQLRRLKLGDKIEEAHMRNRHWVSSWVYEKGKGLGVIDKVKKDNKTYFVINSYEKLRELFGQLLREVQRIKSQGDFKAAQELVETYGVNVDRELHEEVLDRIKNLPVPPSPYKGYVQAMYKIKKDEKDNEIVDILLDNVNIGFMEQMMYFCEHYSFL